MRKRIGILASLVEKHYNDVYFLVDTNNTFVQEVKQRIGKNLLAVKLKLMILVKSLLHY